MIFSIQLEKKKKSFEFYCHFIEIDLLNIKKIITVSQKVLTQFSKKKPFSLTHSLIFVYLFDYFQIILKTVKTVMGFLNKNKKQIISIFQKNF